MKLKALVLGMAIVAVSGTAVAEDPVTPAKAAGTTNGTVTFQGSVSDVPCSIDDKNQHQTVKFGDIALHELTSKKFRSDSEKFNIVLKNCSTDTYKNAQITFTGSTVSGIAGFTGELLGLGGSIQNAGIAITDDGGNPVTFGTAFPAKGKEFILSNDANTTLRFAAYVKGSESEDKKATTGNFDTVTNFKISYQ